MSTDYRGILEASGLVVDRYCWLCHGYCLMGNHYHLLVETPRANLPIGMRHLNGCHTRSFNWRWGRVGHLFQGRYKAEVVEKQSYLLELVRYIALNPVRTEPPLCATPERYRWSSYGILLGRAPQPDWLTIDWVLKQFGDDYDGARARLSSFVDGGRAGDRPQAVGGVYLRARPDAAEIDTADRMRSVSRESSVDERRQPRSCPVVVVTELFQYPVDRKPRG